MGYVERHLLPGERVLYKTRLHWGVFIKPALLVLAGVALTVLLRPVRDPRWLWMIGAGVALLGLGWGLVHYVEVMTSEFAVTTSRLIFKVGLISRYTTELLLAKVESIGVQQGLVGRVLNYGDLTVTGTGGAREVFRRVRDPIGFRNHVQQASLGAGAETGAGGA
ncbi:MAG TPA: PH domain-containing protein [Methylomirabilota bacterium]|nr:PH domain-containing protein [Methylomirabilota bacterium]